MTDGTASPDFTAAHYLRLLKRRGVDHLIANAGTDFAPIIEAMAGGSAEGGDFPAPVIAPHEQAAIAMAHGYYLVSGRPQAVMVHVNVGLANTVMGVLNAASENVPILVTSGRTPVTETGRTGHRDVPIHWGQEMRDQAGMLREAVKWDYELRYGEEAELLIDRALAVAMAEPRGPVYLALPREVLAQGLEAPPPAPQPAVTRPSVPHPDPQAVAQAADILMAAERPLILTARAGRDHAAVPLLAGLADRFALPVIEFWSTDMSMASDHPMHAGYEPDFQTRSPDAVLVLDSMVPWLPARHPLPEGCPVIQLGPDPVFARTPVRGFPVTIGITAGVAAGLAALTDALERRQRGQRRRINARHKALRAENEARRRARLDRAEPVGDLCTHGWVSRCLDERKEEDAIVFSELGADRGAMRFSLPGSYFGLPIAGGLGWAVPAALGARLAAPDRTVIATVGDGSYMFCNPVACHQIAEANGLPILTIVFNNGIWNAVKRAALSVYPDGRAARANRMPLTALTPAPAYEQVVAASGGHGERVEHPEDLPAALDRALAVVRQEKRQALLNVHVR